MAVGPAWLTRGVLPWVARVVTPCVAIGVIPWDAIEVIPWVVMGWMTWVAAAMCTEGLVATSGGWLWLTGAMLPAAPAVLM